MDGSLNDVTDTGTQSGVCPGSGRGRVRGKSEIQLVSPGSTPLS